MTEAPRQIMLVAGETSGDRIAAELVEQLRLHPGFAAPPFSPKFFGAGGPAMARAGVELHCDMTVHAVFGWIEVIRDYPGIRRLFNELMALAGRRLPELIILVDYGGFNRRFASAIRALTRTNGQFRNWRPRIVYFVSPQVWASRPGRAQQIEQDVDLLLSVIPFEKDWYARHAPRLKVEFVGHPLVDRHRQAPHSFSGAGVASNLAAGAPAEQAQNNPVLLLLPGSRPQEISKHVPLMLAAARRIRARRPLRVQMVLPSAALESQARELASGGAAPPGLEIRVEEVGAALPNATVAVASSGTVTLECALFRVPTVVIYKLAWSTYFLAKQIVTIEHIAMPNLLLSQRVLPELIQGRATAAAIASEIASLLDEPARREFIQSRMRDAAEALGPPGAARRAAEAIAKLLSEPA